MLDPHLIPRASLENPATSLSDPAQWFVDCAIGDAGRSFGPAISERTAMAVSAVYRCVTLRAGLLATLPLKVFRRTPEGREEAPGHRVAPLLKVAPYPGRPMTAFTWRELIGLNVDLWGNHFAVIRYDNAARVIGFEPVMPWAVEVRRVGRRNVYVVTHEDGAREVVDQADMLHIPGPGFDGVLGMSRIRFAARDAVALAKVLEEQTGVLHENAARPSGFVEVPSGISAEGFRRMVAQFNERYAGRANAGRVYFGDAGAKFTPLQMTPADLATIEFRRFQVADISRFFGVPLPLLNETDRSTSWGSGIAEQNLAFLMYTMDADLSRIEAELNYKLFAGAEYYCEFDRGALLAMDPARAAQVMQTEIASGLLTINEGRRLRNRPPVAGGDVPLVNGTNVPLDRQLAAPAAGGDSHA